MNLSAQICSRCGTRFYSANFLPYRVAGYCSHECRIGEPRGVPSDESIAYKDCFSIPSSLRKRYEPLPESSEPLPRMVFDMVRYPRPIGWRIENWRIIEDDSKEKGRFIDKTNKKTA